MEEFQEKKKWRRFLHSRATLAFLIVVFLLVLRADYNVYKKYNIARMNKENSEARYNALLERKEMLVSQIGKLKTDRGMEEELRRKFQVAKPGEEVLIIVDKGGGAVEASPPEKTTFEKIKESVLGFFGI